MDENKKKSVTFTTVRPTGLRPPTLIGGVSSGVEPTFQEYYIRKPKIKP